MHLQHLLGLGSTHWLAILKGHTVGHLLMIEQQGIPSREKALNWLQGSTGGRKSGAHGGGGRGGGGAAEELANCTLLDQIVYTDVPTVVPVRYTCFSASCNHLVLNNWSGNA